MRNKTVRVSECLSYGDADVINVVLRIESPAFKDGDIIPKRFTCEGEDISPPLLWAEVPRRTRSLAIICDDPDASMGTWDHWILFNIDPSKGSLPEGVPKQRRLPEGEVHGMNSWGRSEYGGPCPPPGKPHRYIFKLFALDTKLSISPGSSKSELLESMKTHILEKARLMGIFGR